MSNRIQRIPVALALLALLTLNLQLRTARAQGTTFTYQGQLQNNGILADGTYNLEFSLFNIPSGGSAIAGPVTTNGVAITNGLFTVHIDFGSSVWNGETNWLQISVETNGAGSFTTLSSRQQVTPAPYAIFAASASNLVGVLPADQLAGPVPGSDLSGVYTGAVNFDNPANSFTGNGTGLTNVNAALLDGLASSNFWQTSGNAGTSPANGNFVGTTDYQPLELRVSGERALRLEPATNGAPNLIGGSPVNLVIPGFVGSTIAGGGSTNDLGSPQTNSIAADYAFIGGGDGHAINSNSDYSLIAGGQFNLVDADSEASAVLGGAFNSVFQNTDHSSIGGGYFNIIIPYYGSSDAIGGGENNAISGAYIDDAFIGGGNGNQAEGSAATVSGGEDNTATNNYSTVGGGINNIASGKAATVAGGGQESFAASDSGVRPAESGGNQGNMALGDYSSIGGGSGNQASGTGSAISGGQNNTSSGTQGTVGGGFQNTAGGLQTTAAGGTENNAYGDHSTVGGGQNNTAYGAADTLAGGANNYSAGGNVSTISGGEENGSSGSDAVIGGGMDNQVSAVYATIGGGVDNTATNNSDVVSGGTNNISGGTASTVAGGADNIATGDYSFAAGEYADATNNYSFVWSDGSAGTFSTRTNEFVARASGGFALFSSPAGTGVSLAPGSGSWSSMSDRNAKEDFAPVDPQTVLARVSALPLETWSYKTESGVRHVGPMAQDFYSAFGVGEDDRHIADVDESGVALAAIQGLNQELKQQLAEKQVEITRLQQQNQSLEQRLNDLAQAVHAISQRN